MASAKRKRDTDDGGTKSGSKRSKPEAKTTASKLSTKSAKDKKVRVEDKGKAAVENPTKAPAKSLLAKEQPAFPRGGAGLLTPIERKQINARAVRDAAAEQNSTKGLFDIGDPTAEAASDGDIPIDQPSAGQSKKGKAKKAKQSRKDDTTSRPTKVGGLSYKRIAVGSLILGQITSISTQDLTVALPNNLVGYVPLTSISKQLSKKIEALLEDQPADEGANKDDEEDLRLNDYFYVGQTLRVVVTSTGLASDGSTKSRRRLELSIEPGFVNTGLNRSSLVVGTMVQASVSSVEDHGLVADLDLEDGNIRGFISTKVLPASLALTDVREGSVYLCQVTSFGSSGKVAKLCADPSKFVALKTAPNIDSFLPGTLTDVLVTEVHDAAAVGKIMGMITATVDLVHSGAYLDKDAFDRTFQVGKKIRGRIICNFATSEDTSIRFSVLDNMIQLNGDAKPASEQSSTLLSKVIPTATVTKVEPGLGVYLDLGSGRHGFAHISRLADQRVDTLGESSGPFKKGSQHKIRILDFNPLDNLYIVSLQESVIEQAFLRVEDVPIGQVAKGTISKVLIGPAGVKGVIVSLADGVTGLVPEMHLSDVVLQHPEKKFREGATVKARVLSTDIPKRQSRLTLKKTLVNSDTKIWQAFNIIEVGDSSLGTLTKVDAHGALVQFYGTVRGFLPVSEMSEAYIKDAREHFRPGQVLTVTAVNVDAKQQRLTLSCRDSTNLGQSAESLLASLKPGSLTTGVVFEKSDNDVQLRLEGSDAIARLTVDHVSDGSLHKRQTALARIRVGQKLEDLLILDVQTKRRLVVLCNRRSLVKAAKAGNLLDSFEHLKTGMSVTGFVSNITTDGVFISFVAGMSGLILPQDVVEGDEDKPDFAMAKLQVVASTVKSVDYKGATPRFWLTLKDSRTKSSAPATDETVQTGLARTLSDAVDSTLETEADLVVDKITKARIISIKDTQLNVELAKDVQGRLDVSEIFDRWEDIKDRKRPLQHYSQKQILDVKVIGAHDTRNHRFLPLSHRTGKNTVYELTAKPASVHNADYAPLQYSDLQVGSSWVAFVNNITHDCVWVSISPSVRGRIKAVDVSDDLSHASDLASNFPLGSAIRVRVSAVNEKMGRLDLTARTGDLSSNLTMHDISVGMVLPGRVTKVSDRQVIVQLGESLVGAVDLIDMADDYTQADPAKHQKNDIVRACVLRVDAPNKKINLSLRPSKVLSSAMAVTDPGVSNISQLHVNDIRSGFVRNVDDKGVFVTLGHGITAYVRVGHLSDSYLKEWQDSFQRDQLVRGKIILVDKASGHVQMSLKDSIIKSDYKPPVTFGDLKVGDIVTAKVAKVEAFGVFILVDNSENVRGLCHRSEIAEQRVEDATKLFAEGDVVKAKVLKLDVSKRHVNFGMKASYFSELLDQDVSDADNMSVDSEQDADDSEGNGALLEDLDMDDLENDQDDSDEEGIAPVDGSASDSNEEVAEAKDASTTSLKVGGFDWYGISANTTNKKRNNDASDEEDPTPMEKKQKRKKRAEIQVDRTGDLDANGPRSVDDYERLLPGEADSALMWLQYMAFHLELGDVDQARQVGERALKSIGLGQDAEKLKIWVALLNLENAYGEDESVEAVFKRACEHNDPWALHSRLTSIYIQSGKHSKADDMFQRMLKEFTQDPKVWVNYGTFLFDTVGDADKGRDILPRALQILPKFTHLDVTSKFAQLEFKSSAGLPERGRTIFEGLISSFPKRIDLYNVLLDLEMKLNGQEQIRSLFERIFTSKLKPKQAKYFFKRWLAFEETVGDERRIDGVKARAATWIRSAGKESLA